MYTSNITKMMLALRTVRKKTVDKKSVEKTMALSTDLIEGIAEWFQGILHLLDKRKSNFEPSKLIILFTKMMEMVSNYLAS